jgi:flagellar hook-associated protein 3 FlgL
MRVTQQMLSQTTLNNMEANMARLGQLEAQITSGTRITRPSDDPIGTAQALRLQDGVDQSTQFLANIDQATAWLNATDSALTSVTDAVQRARQLAVQAASETASQTDRQAIDAEVQQLQQQVLGLAQARQGASYLFAGTRSDAPGYVQANPSTVAGAYVGNSGQVQRAVGPGQTIAVNADPTSTFDPVFTAFNQLHTALAGNNTAGIETSIDQLDTALTAVMSSRASVGARTNRLGSLQQQMSAVQLNMTGLLSNDKDVDIAQAITTFSMAQTVYQASLQAGAKVLQQSLLDYLR